MEFLAHLTPKPWGVLGQQLSRKGKEVETRGGRPGEGTAIVDPAGLAYLNELGPRGAEAASGMIYSFLGIQHDAAFPAELVRSKWQESESRGHRYGKVFVIHGVGPDFRKDAKRAEKRLRLVYANVLREFAKCGLQTLRLLPMSAGTHCGPHGAELPDLTARALASAFSDLDGQQKKQVLGAVVELCIYIEDDFERYCEALELHLEKLRQAQAESQPTGPSAREPPSTAGEDADGDRPSVPDSRRSRRQKDQDPQPAARAADGEGQQHAPGADDDGQGESPDHGLGETVNAEKADGVAEVEPTLSAAELRVARKQKKRQQKQQSREGTVA